MNKPINFLTIKDLPVGELKGKRVLVRMDFNVPIKDGVVVDDFRLVKSLPFINFLSQAGAKVILLSHLGDEGASLLPVAEWLNERQPITFYELWPDALFSSELNDGSVSLLNNLRLYPGEIANETFFTNRLVNFADIYINNAFSASHRKHASIVGVPKLLPAYAGPLFEQEFTELSKLFSAEKPFVLILGGVKFSTKVPLLRKYLTVADKIFVLGALAHGFLKQKNLPIGQSLLEDEALFADFTDTEKFILPVDVVVERDGQKVTQAITQVSPVDIIYDAGPETIKLIEEAVKDARTILWNGPLGNFEKGFVEGTEAVAKIVAHASGYSVVGGGDTIASIQVLNLESEFGFMSTAGGAMLDFLSTGTLPGIEALKNS